MKIKNYRIYGGFDEGYGATESPADTETRRVTLLVDPEQLDECAIAGHRIRGRRQVRPHPEGACGHVRVA